LFVQLYFPLLNVSLVVQANCLSLTPSAQTAIPKQQYHHSGNSPLSATTSKMTSLSSATTHINFEQVTKSVIKQFHNLIIGMRDGLYLAEGRGRRRGAIRVREGREGGSGPEGYDYGETVDDQEDANSMLWRMLQKVRIKFMQPGGGRGD
jgi:hypothetical protein